MMESTKGDTQIMNINVSLYRSCLTENILMIWISVEVSVDYSQHCSTALALYKIY